MENDFFCLVFSFIQTKGDCVLKTLKAVWNLISLNSYVNWTLIQNCFIEHKKDIPSEGFFTEGCFALIEGDYTEEETLIVIAIGHPPCERREISR